MFKAFLKSPESLGVTGGRSHPVLGDRLAIPVSQVGTRAARASVKRAGSQPALVLLALHEAFVCDFY